MVPVPGLADQDVVFGIADGACGGEHYLEEAVGEGINSESVLFDQGNFSVYGVEYGSGG